MKYVVYAYRAMTVKCVEGSFHSLESAIEFTKHVRIGFQIKVGKLTIEENGVEVYSCDRLGGLSKEEWLKENNINRGIEAAHHWRLLAKEALEWAEYEESRGSYGGVQRNQAELYLETARKLELEAGGYAP